MAIEFDQQTGPSKLVRMDWNFRSLSKTAIRTERHFTQSTHTFAAWFKAVKPPNTVKHAGIYWIMRFPKNQPGNPKSFQQPGEELAAWNEDRLHIQKFKISIANNNGEAINQISALFVRPHATSLVRQTKNLFKLLNKIQKTSLNTSEPLLCSDDEALSDSTLANRPHTEAPVRTTMRPSNGQNNATPSVQG